MLQRIITGVVAICALVPFLIFSEDPAFVFLIFAAIMAGVGVWEMHACIGCKKYALLIPALVYVCAAIVLTRYPVGGLFGMDYCAVLLLLSFLYLAYLFVFAVLSHRKPEPDGALPLTVPHTGEETAPRHIAAPDVLTVFAVTFYVVFGFACVVLLRDIPAVGVYIYLLAFFGSWVTDTFAYFTGRFFGKHKLIEPVSPKKTIEGAIGGIVFCVLFMLGYGFVVERWIADVSANYLLLALAGLVLSVVGMFGDLVASLIKRYYHIKDYGKLFPGHGGVMDRFDSVLFCAPCLYIFCTIPGVALFTALA